MQEIEVAVYHMSLPSPTGKKALAYEAEWDYFKAQIVEKVMEGLGNGFSLTGYDPRILMSIKFVIQKPWTE